ncbi:hypothetical protein CPB83DRAFT_894913 [Crepidotus variabilis]|uniref:Cupredoxin n=1 Tax=Crepidotus variabilis TaxID=179855 RepID=A0A9P6EF40_9AGAR|nr:hypothetical protein CPB83DRAFT_894913 [Crepidotus variabilis]
MVQLSLSQSIVLLSTLLVAFQSACAFEFSVMVGEDETTGKKGLGFTPSTLMTQAGDVITFKFASGVHSVVQSTYDAPCVALSGGYDAGVHTVDNSKDLNATDLPTEKLTINTDGPMWLFDRAGGVCFKGAVLAINPTANQTALGFKANAAQAGASTPTGSTPTSSAGPGSTATSPAIDSPQNNGALDVNPKMLKTSVITVGGLLFSGLWLGFA